MKKIFTLAIIALSMAVSCQKDPLAEIEKGDWNKEKRLIGIKYEWNALIGFLTIKSLPFFFFFWLAGFAGI